MESLVADLLLVKVTEMALYIVKEEIEDCIVAEVFTQTVMWHSTVRITSSIVHNVVLKWQTLWAHWVLLSDEPSLAGIAVREDKRRAPLPPGTIKLAPQSEEKEPKAEPIKTPIVSPDEDATDALPQHSSSLTTRQGSMNTLGKDQSLTSSKKIRAPVPPTAGATLHPPPLKPLYNPFCVL